MKTKLQRLPSWSKRLLAAQALTSFIAAVVYTGGESQSIWYAITVGLLPSAFVVAYVFRLPHSKFMLLTYCAFTVALGGLVLVATLVESLVSVENWVTLSRLVLGLQVAVGAMLLVTLTRARDRWGHRN